VPENFEVTPAILDEFQSMLSSRNIRPGLAEWSRERDWIQNRLKQEILNQGLGVAKGDEVELERDPVALAALRAIQGR
jgi:carboxyl-terminal processing protease